MRTSEAIDLNAVHAAVDADYWNDRLVSANDHEIRLSVMTSAFGWHRHPDSDEVFLCIDGSMVVEFEHGEIVLGPGQMISVPRGVLHRTRPSGARSVNITFERAGAETIFEDAAPGD
jgi:mannose-6-phosphate isomerase-like protein (cupin superfamily)